MDKRKLKLVRPNTCGAPVQKIDGLSEKLKEFEG